MRRQITTITFAAIALFLYGCDAEAPTPVAPQAASGHVSANSLDWQGRYTGVLPCADCPGIVTLLTLDLDQSYRLSKYYLGKDDKLFEQRGVFIWEENGNVIHLQNSPDGPDRYQVGENILFQLDKQGKRISGDLAEDYILHKVKDD
ncbi:copper resistance protein NlpE [Nitrosomonas nitrosa]|uniref:copper resistance protein NlpE n=1 Tax=Nitrosomonas nitrosa TaxID=52442 RepID=UPI0023FA20C5|nr:copper resistance protein NlpE [Nitrosomonas nitrosa]MCO6433634.1 copper resistance protein NlpE N-terminal domain-containing protein [Nitrosomonas nitrosa]